MKSYTLILSLFAGILLFADVAIAQPGIITTIAGNHVMGYAGDGGPATNAQLYGPAGLVTDISGNLYIADYGNNRIRKVAYPSGLITTVAGTGTLGYAGDGGPATAASMHDPDGIALDASGNIFFTEQGNHCVRMINVATGVITTVAGTGTAGYSGDNMPATASELYVPSSVAFDAAGDLYIADWGNNRIRKVTLSTGIITTVAGTGTAAYSGDGGPATAATFNKPSGIAFDVPGNSYISEYGNNAVRKITTATGMISTVAGTGVAGYSGDGGIATAARLYQPLGVQTDTAGNIYIADWNNSRVRMVSAATGYISTIAGNGAAGYSGDGGHAVAASLNQVDGIAMDINRNLYIADENNSVIRKVTCPVCPLPPPNPALQKNLYYACKVWGFVKYYHSNVNTCQVNWDSVLLHVLPLVENAVTGTQFNDALDTMLAAAGTMALSATYFPDTLPTALKRNRDWNWIDSASFRSDVQIQLDTIRNNFRPHVICSVVADTLTRALTDPWGGYLKFPYDTTLLNVNTVTNFPDEDHRLLMMFKFWNIVRYFNPYNYVLDKPWDTTLFNYVVPIDTVSDPRSLYLLYMNMAAALNDEHVCGLAGSSNYQMMPGVYVPSIRLMYINGQYVVINSLQAGINRGDAIISIDGLTAIQWEDSLRQYYSSGNQSVFRRTMSEQMLGRQVYGTPETLVVQDSTGASHTFNVNCNQNLSLAFFQDNYYPADSLNSISWDVMPCGIGYVNLSNLQVSDVNTMYNGLKSKKAIIFDLRHYPNTTEAEIANLLFPNVITDVKFMMPDVTYPGTYNWQYESGGFNNPAPYTGKVIILMNEVTFSQAEFYCMILESTPGAVKVGSQTSGADGNVSWFHLSQDIKFGYTSLGVFYPNGDSTQRIGIVPDSVVYPTKAGIRHHRDEVLETALKIAGCNLYVSNTTLSTAAIQVFPNPANDLITIEATNITAKNVMLAITDITGRTLMQKTIEYNNPDFSASFNIKPLAAGMYFVTVTADGEQYVRKVVKE